MSDNGARTPRALAGRREYQLEPRRKSGDNESPKADANLANLPSDLTDAQKAEIRKKLGIADENSGEKIGELIGLARLDQTGGINIQFSKPIANFNIISFTLVNVNNAGLERVRLPLLVPALVMAGLAGDSDLKLYLTVNDDGGTGVLIVKATSTANQYNFYLGVVHDSPGQLFDDANDRIRVHGLP